MSSHQDPDPTFDYPEELAEIVEAALVRHRQGEPVDAEVLAGAHPEYADELRRMLPTLLSLEGRSDVLDFAESGEEKRLGDFRIVRELGRGGMGLVLEAWQESLGRHVALKILPPQAVLDPRLRQRFQREAQAAASLHHPHIVPVYGLGESDGIHYFAMQYISGKTLAEALAEMGSGNDPWSRADGTESSNLTLSGSSGQLHGRRVAEIGRQVADALAHAHGEGVLHRDIKPSNLILDEKGHIWVTDFGLAKMDSREEITATGDLLGTPRYMAPESLQGWSDPRTDVYGLGVTLYELLTRQPAFPHRDRARLLAAIECEDPIAPRKHDPGISRDLETIVLAALQRDPRRRYADARALADDLDRFLERQPILARRSTWSYRARLFVQRNRWGVGAALGVLALTVGLTTSWLISVRSARDDALTEQGRAERSFELSLDVIRAMITRFAADELSYDPNWTPLRQELVERAVALYDDLLADEPESLRLRREAAATRLQLAQLQALAGQARASLATVERALEVLGSGREDDPLRALLLLGSIRAHERLGHRKKGEALLERVRAWAASDALPRRGETLRALVGLAAQESEFRHLPEADFALEKAAAVADELLAQSRDSSVVREVFRLQSRTSRVRYDEHRYADVVRAGERVRELYERLEAAGEVRTGDRFELAVTLARAANALEEERQFETAGEWSAEAVALLDELVAAAPGYPSYRNRRASALARWAYNLRSRGKLPESLERLERSRQDSETVRAQTGLDYPETLNWIMVLDAIGVCHRRLGDLESAESSHRGGLAAYDGAVASYDERPDLQRVGARLRINLAIVLKRQGRLDESRGVYEDALEELPAGVADDIRAILLMNLGNLARQAEDFEGARDLLLESEVATEQALETGRRSSLELQLANVCTIVAYVEERLGLAEESREHHQKAVRVAEDVAQRAPRNPRVQSLLGACLNNLGEALIAIDPEESEALLLRAVEAQSRAHEANPKNPVYRQFLANHYLALSTVSLARGRWSEAAERAHEATRIDGDEPDRWLAKAGRLCEIAAGCADPEQQRQFRAESLAAVEEALGRGFADAAALRADDSLADLRGSDEFRELLRRAESASATNGDRP